MISLCLQPIEDHNMNEKPQFRKEVRKVQLNYRSIGTIDFVSDYFHYIQELYLNHNMIRSLDGIEQFKTLKVFHIRFNFISSLDEFDQISNQFLLKSLNIKGNPVERDPKCNMEFIKRQYFQNLQSYNCDSEKEIYSTPKRDTVASLMKIKAANNSTNKDQRSQFFYNELPTQRNNVLNSSNFTQHENRKNITPIERSSSAIQLTQHRNDTFSYDQSHYLYLTNVDYYKKLFNTKAQEKNGSLGPKINENYQATRQFRDNQQFLETHQCEGELNETNSLNNDQKIYDDHKFPDFSAISIQSSFVSNNKKLNEIMNNNQQILQYQYENNNNIPQIQKTFQKFKDRDVADSLQYTVKPFDLGEIDIKGSQKTYYSPLNNMLESEHIQEVQKGNLIQDRPQVHPSSNNSFSINFPTSNNSLEILKTHNTSGVQNEGMEPETQMDTARFKQSWFNFTGEMNNKHIEINQSNRQPTTGGKKQKSTEEDELEFEQLPMHEEVDTSKMNRNELSESQNEEINKYIEQIDDDIIRLADVFYQQNLIQQYWKNLIEEKQAEKLQNIKAVSFYQNALVFKVFSSLLMNDKIQKIKRKLGSSYQDLRQALNENYQSNLTN